MPTNTNYDPKKSSDFTKDDLQFSGQAIYFECLENTESFGELTLAEDFLLTGGDLLVENGKIEDKIFLQIIHPTFGVVNEFVSGYRIMSDSVLQTKINSGYPAKLSAGLKIRCKYVAGAGTAARKIAVNLSLHRVMF